MPEFWSEFQTWLGTIMQSAISAAALVAVVLSVLFNGLRGRRSAAPWVADDPDERGSLPKSTAH